MVVLQRWCLFEEVLGLEPKLKAWVWTLKAEADIAEADAISSFNENRLVGRAFRAHKLATLDRARLMIMTSSGKLFSFSVSCSCGIEAVPFADVDTQEVSDFWPIAVPMS